MLKRRFMHSLVAALVLVSLLCQGTWVLAGTTGSLTGTVLDTAANAPLSGAKVTATSPSQTVSTTTDNGGHFTFASLAPDSYTLSVEKQGYDAVSQSGITVFADQSQTLQISTRKSLREIGRVTSRASTDLVKPGTTADVYSVNALQQEKFAGVGGGGGLNNAYSAIATVPGAYVPQNQSGYYQTIHIRGGDYDQVGYEVDGVPVNRSFDNYPSGSASSLGQQELQVYTGAAPANAEGQGLAGFINQVIKTGTYPGYANVDFSVGGPAFYHKASFEFGGATPDRNFSYYVGLGGYNQDFRYVDQGNAQGLLPYGPILGTTSGTLFTSDGVVPQGAGVVTGPYDLGLLSSLVDRDTVANVHIGIPHHHDGSKDDIQILYLNNFLRTQFFSSPGDTGLNNFFAAQGGVPTEADSLTYTGAVGAFLPGNFASLVKPYYFPSTPLNRSFGAPIPGDNRDSYQNNQVIFKVQYQKNFSSNAYFRLYGYTDYSNWLQNGQNFANNVYFNLGFPVDAVSADYELSSHSRGISGTFADQINAQNLIQFQGSYTTATTLRDNNASFRSGGGSRSPFAVLVNSNAPTSGICYNATLDPVTGTPLAPGAAPIATDCNTFTGAPHASTISLRNVANGSAIPGNPNYVPANNVPLAGLTCGTGPCQYYVVENGTFATYNTVKPNFIAGSLTDTFKPNDKLFINLGIRYDLFQFQGSDTTGTPARQMFFNSFNQGDCINLANGKPVSKVSGLGQEVTVPCPAGFATPNLVNASALVQTYPVFEPRIGATYQVNPNTVLRASYGRYAQAPNTAFEQYNSLQQNSPYSLLGPAFYNFGFTTPSHNVRPEVSNNYDFSLEHHFRGSDVSFKLTPFYRYTQDQIQTFFLDQASGFVSGLNADRLTSRGFEFQLNKGDFGRDGFAAQLAFTYTNAYAQYNTFANGTNVFTTINADIANYNAYTSACAPGGASVGKKQFGQPVCGTTSSAVAAAPCYTTAGAADPVCAAGSIANPYYKVPAQSLVDPNGQYAPFSLITDQIGASANSYLVPYVTTLVMQYKKGQFAITPSLQFQGGNRYGVPEANPGVDPVSCTAGLAGSTTGDPRYPHGAVGGSPFDATACATLNGGLSAIPNTYTGAFDGVGAFVQPNNLSLNMQLTYEASKKVRFVATFANILNNCFGGSQEPWTNGGSQVCSYGLVDNGNAYPPVGNAYNPGKAVAPILQYPYARSYGVFNTNGTAIKNPFSVFLDAQFKL